MKILYMMKVCLNRNLEENDTEYDRDKNVDTNAHGW